MEAPKHAGTDKRVLLCFHCDPYSPEAVASGVTAQAMSVLSYHRIPFQILTKGGMRAARDFVMYGPNDAFATTMTFLDPSCSEMYEPGASPPANRIAAIQEGHKRGIETWVSLEPVVAPSESLAIIEHTHEYVDLYKIGKLNHDKASEAQIDWRAFGIRAIDLCKKYGKPYYIKADLAKHLDGVKFTNTDTRMISR